jgi:N utilization substance protein B
MNMAEQRRAARLAAVQALYQMDVAGATTADVGEDFRSGRLPRGETGPLASEADAELFRQIIEHAVDRQDSVDRAILRAGVAELAVRADIPTAVVIDEYVEIANAFFDGAEPGFINAALDACAKDVRGGMSERAE